MPFQKGQQAWNKGKQMSEDTRKKVSNTKKGTPAWNKGKKCQWVSERNKVMNRLFKSKENHHFWKGGVSKIDKSIREMPEYKLWRSQVFERDSWTCQTCGLRGYITAHHIKSFASILRENNLKNTIEASECELLWDITNGVTLCEECHKLTDNYKGRKRSK